MNAKDKNIGLVELSDDELNVVAGGVITAPGPGGGPNVRVFDASTSTFFAYDVIFRGGVRVASGDGGGGIFNDGGTLN